LRGAFEASLIAFAVGFGAAQYLAYLTYHEQNRLILAEAVPINENARNEALTATPSGRSPTTNQRIDQTIPSEAATPAATPKVVARAAVPPSSKVSNTDTVTPEELGGGVALAGLITGSGTDAGRAAPNFELAALDRSDVSLGAMRGKVVLLNFWATWCGACRSEMPSLEKLYQDFRSYPDFKIVTVSTDERGEASVAQFMEKRGYDFPVLMDNSNATSTAYGVSGIPSTFVIGRDGRIIWNCVGGIDWSNPTLRAALKKLL
jgi:peroxiredoxin